MMVTAQGSEARNNGNDGMFLICSEKCGKKLKGVLEAYLGGQAGGGAVVEVLFGDVNPSGKLAETFPLILEDTPCFNYFPGNMKSVEHRESIYVGYRYYEKASKEAR